MTSRECATIISAVVGGLLELAHPDAVRDAVRWCAETDDYWAVLAAGHERTLAACRAVVYRRGDGDI